MTSPDTIRKLHQLLEEAERNRLFGEILLRFRNGHLCFVTQTTTLPVEDGTNDYERTRTLRCS